MITIEKTPSGELMMDSKLAIYIALLTLVRWSSKPSNLTSRRGMCNWLSLLEFDNKKSQSKRPPYVGVGLLPELLAQKPPKLHGWYWWKVHDTTVRIRALNQAIEKCVQEQGDIPNEKIS
jgi:hypothetical protein